MNRHIIQIITSYRQETVQMTGKVGFSTVDVFRHGRIESVLKSSVVE